MSKYQVSIRHKFRMEHDTPRLSDHVVGGLKEGPGRWDERMPVDAHAPETVLKEAIELPEARHLPHWKNNQVDNILTARCHSEEGEYTPVFVQNNNCIVTVYRAREIDHVPSKSYIIEAARQTDVIE